MSKWLIRLREIEESKINAKLPVSVLSVHNLEISQKNNKEDHLQKVESPYFQPLSVLSGVSSHIFKNQTYDEKFVKHSQISTDNTDNAQISPITSASSINTDLRKIPILRTDNTSKGHNLLHNAKDLPLVWQLALAKTLNRPRPSKIIEDKWFAIIAQIHQWLNQDIGQLKKIIADGWTIQDIFGCHYANPQRLDHMGLLLLLQDKTIERVNMGAITLKTSAGAMQCFYKRLPNSSPEGTLIYAIEHTTEAMDTSEVLSQTLSPLSFTLPGTGSVVESIAATINDAGLKDLSWWVNPKMAKSETSDVAQKKLAPLPVLKVDEANVQSFLLDLKQAGLTLSVADKELNAHVTRLTLLYRQKRLWTR